MASPNGPLQRCNSTQDVSTQSKIAPPDATISHQRPAIPLFRSPRKHAADSYPIDRLRFRPKRKRAAPFQN